MTLRNIGDCYAVLDQPQAARYYYSRALEQDKNDPDSLYKVDGAICRCLLSMFRCTRLRSVTFVSLKQHNMFLFCFAHTFSFAQVRALLGYFPTK